MDAGSVLMECPECGNEITVYIGIHLGIIHLLRMKGCSHAEAWNGGPDDGGIPLGKAA